MAGLPAATPEKDAHFPLFVFFSHPVPGSQAIKNPYLSFFVLTPSFGSLIGT